MPQVLHTDDEAGTVVSVLDDLCGREDVRPQDVVVLSAHGREHSAIYGAKTGPWQYTDKRGRKGKRVFFSSIRGFKGPGVPGGGPLRAGRPRPGSSGRSSRSHARGIRFL